MRDLLMAGALGASALLAGSFTATAADWSGFYAGVIAGSGFGDVNYDVVGSPMFFELPTAGVLAGVTLGANAQYGRFVLGAEGDLSASGIRGGPKAIPPTMTVANTSVDWTASARMRAGVATDWALFYVTGGVAAARIASTSDYPSEFAATHSGWVAGAGIEAMISEQISVKADYSVYSFGAVNDGSAYNGGSGNSVDILPTLQTATVGINFHF